MAIPFIGFIGNAQIINFPDTNFKAKLLTSSISNNVAENSSNVRIKIDANNDGEIQISEAAQVYYLNVGYGSISNLSSIENFTNLRGLVCSYNSLTQINVSQLSHITYLSCDNNQLSSLDVTQNSALDQLACQNNLLTALDVTQNPALYNLHCNHNQLMALDVTHNHNLNFLHINNNQITSIDVSQNPNLDSFLCHHNQITALDLAANPNLFSLGCSNNLLTSLDLSHNSQLDSFDCSSNLLTYLNMKNGRSDIPYIYDNPNLQYVCVDTWIAGIDNFEYDSVGEQLQGTDIPYGDYCSFVPGGTYYNIQGTIKVDLDNNGCDTNDLNVPNLRTNISNGTVSSAFLADTTGSYNFPVPAGTHTLSPIFENPNYFTVSPSSFNVVFPASPSPFLQDLCITANGTHNDLEINILPLNGAIPGFNSSYKIIYKNKGTQTQSGTVSLDYYDPIEDFVSANPNFTSESSNFMHNLNWSFSNLSPFESREIVVTFNLNSPTETPPVNAGNLIQHTARIVGLTDETPDDNTSLLTQSVVNSYDPNDKVCTEGNVLPINEVGKYLHYIIRFENTGTANAENIVVKDMIDTSKFDLSSLVPLHGSHSFETRINSNRVEFIFENIDLPFDDANNDGYVAFKIKTLPTLAVGDNVINSASIYFDYNFPIVTDPYTVTVYNPLSTVDFDFGSVYTLSPIPAKDILKITTKKNVAMSSVNIYNMLGQLVQVNTNPSETIDVSSLKTGSYFIKIISDKGTASSKFVKE